MLLFEPDYPIQEGMKRTVQVNVKMSQEDFDLLRKAAEKRWPDAVITNSGVVPALAKIAAREHMAITVNTANILSACAIQLLLRVAPWNNFPAP
jgi:hypothetical protein